MNISKYHWAKFKQELIPLVFLSTLNIWWIFNFPPYIQLGNPWTTIVRIIACIIVTMLYLFLFVFANQKTSMFYSEYPYGNFSRIMNILTFHLVFFFAWYKNMYTLSNLYYVLLYISILITFTLIARAANRQPKVTSQEQ